MNEELKVIISAEISKLKQNVEKAKQQVKGFQEQVKKASADVDKNFKAIGSAMATGAKAAATGLAAAAGAILALGASTAEYRAEQAKLTAAFETAGSSAEVAKSTYNDLYRVLGDGGQAVEAANHLAKLTTEEKALSEWTNICQGVYATFGASLPIESLTEAANETAKTGTLTGALADALNWAGISEDAFTESLAACATEAEREALIRETLNGLYSDAASTYEKNNSAVLEQNEAQARLQETTAKVGEAVAPVVTAFTAFANDALALVVPYLQQMAEQYLPLLESLLKGLAESLAAAFEWVVQHKTVLAVMAGIIGGIAAAIGLYNAVAAVKAAMAALEVTSVWALVAAYAAQAAAMIVAIAPYVLIVAAIAAVIAIIVLCVKHWDTIKEATVKAFAKIKEVVQKAIDSVVWFFKKMLDWIKENWQGLLLLIVNPFAGAFKLAYDNCESFRNKVDSFISKVKELFKAGFNFIKERIISPIKEAFSNVVSVFSNIVTTIREKINSAKDAVKSAIDKIKGFFKFEWSLPKLKLPKISIEGKFSLSPPEVPKFSINWNALGGVFDKPSIFGYGGSLQGIGEAGAEAVVPLENNLGWLDKLATMLAARMGNGTPVVLNVDGKVFAQTAINTINQQTRQTGKLQLNLV